MRGPEPSEYAACATVECLRRDSKSTGCIPGDVAAPSQRKKSNRATFSQRVTLGFTDVPAHAAVPHPTARHMPSPRTRFHSPQLLPRVSDSQPGSVRTKHLGPSHLQEALDRPQHSDAHGVQAARWKACSPRTTASSTAPPHPCSRDTGLRELVLVPVTLVPLPPSDTVTLCCYALPKNRCTHASASRTDIL